MKWLPSSSTYVASGIRAAAEAMSRAPASTSHLRGHEARRHPDLAQRDPAVLGGGMARCMYQSIGVVRNSADRVGRALGVGDREHEPAVAEHRDGPRADRQPGGDRRDRPAGELQRPRDVDGERRGRPAGQPQRAEHGGERVTGDAGHREQAGDPLGVAEGQLEHGVDAHRPAHDRRPGRSPKWSITERASSTKASMPQCDAGRPGRSEPPVPRWFHDTMRTPQSAARNAGQVHGAGAEAVAEQDRRAVDGPVGVVGPGGQPGPVVGEDVVVGDARCRERRGRRRSACPDCAGAGSPAVWPSHRRREGVIGRASQPSSRPPSAPGPAVPGPPGNALDVLAFGTPCGQRGAGDHRVAAGTQLGLDGQRVHPVRGRATRG